MGNVKCERVLPNVYLIFFFLHFFFDLRSFCCDGVCFLRTAVRLAFLREACNCAVCVVCLVNKKKNIANLMLPVALGHYFGTGTFSSS